MSEEADPSRSEHLDADFPDKAQVAAKMHVEGGPWALQVGAPSSLTHASETAIYRPNRTLAPHLIDALGGALTILCALAGERLTGSNWGLLLGLAVLAPVLLMRSGGHVQEWERLGHDRAFFARAAFGFAGAAGAAAIYRWIVPMDPAFYSQERFFAVFGAFALMAMISLAFGVYLVRRARD
jgi:hypothetical protein